jgi:hypothetical protein
LRAAKLRLRVACELPDVDLLIDGKKLGVTDGIHEFQQTLKGAGQLVLQRPGYSRQRVALRSSGTQRVRCRLTPRPATSKTARLRVVVSESGSSQWLDGHPRANSGVVSGRHTLRVERSGFEPWSQVVSLESGREHTLTLRLEPTDAYRTSFEHNAWRQRFTAYALASAGALLAAGGGAIYVYDSRRHHDWRQRSRDLPPRAELTRDQQQEQRELDGLQGSIRAWDNVARSMIVVGAVAVGAGAGLYLFGEDPNRYSDTESWSIRVTGLSMQYQSQF